MLRVKKTTWRWAGSLAAVLLLALAAQPAWGQQADKPVPELEGVGVTEHLGEPIPLVLPFNDSNGNRVHLGDYFDGQRPVILTLNYFKCPMLCGLMLSGLSDGLAELNWTPGTEFEVVTVSINPLEKPPLAKENKQGYVKLVGKPGVASGWHFLTGNQDEITALADAVGFEYVLDPDSGQFLHQAAIFVITPEGRISRYLYGVQYSATDLKLALSEAADGKIGNTVERVFLTCYSYDPASGGYVLQALGLMRLGGILTVVVLVIVLGGFWLRERARRQGGAGDSMSEESVQ
jgi:protein SCO1/2